MTCRLISALWLAFTAPRLAAGTAADAFQQANLLYEQGRYADAAAAYQALINGGNASPAVFFNLGNSLFKGGQVGRAIVNYRLAEQRAPRDPDIRANLQFARDSVAGGGGVGRGRRWLPRLTLNEGALLTAAVFWFWLVLLTVRQLRPSLRRPLRGATVTTGAVAALLIAATALLWFQQRRVPTAVVVVPEAPVRFGPLAESQAAFTARDGRELSVTDRQGDWLQVADASRRTGWLKRDQVAVLP